MIRGRYCAAVLAVSLFTTPLRAELTFERVRIEAGQVRAGQPLEQRFEFVNSGRDTVYIVAARASCGCAAPRLERRDYPPGARGAVLVNVHSLGQPEGPHLWRIHVGYRSGATEHEAALELSADVVTEVAVRPASLTLFAGQKLTHDIVVTDRRDQPLRIRAVEATSPHLKTSLSEPRLDSAGQRTWTIGLELAPDFPAGRHEEIVTLATDDAGYAELRVKVTVVKRDPHEVTVHPGEVRLDASGGGPIPARIVLVRSGNDRAVIVDDVVADHPAVSCKWARGPGNHATVKFTIDRARLNGDGLNTAARIVISAPAREILDVPIRCVVTPASGTLGR